MLLAIRERVMGVVGWFILGLLIIAFAFFGLNSYLDSGEANYVASVNGVEISSFQEEIAYKNLVSRMQKLMGSSFDLEMIDEDRLRKTALKQIVNEELLFQEALAAKFAASDQQLAAQISVINVFKKDGKFSKQRYDLALSRNGMTASEFEGQLKRDIISDHLRSGIVSTAAPTREALELAFRLQGQKRRFNYLILPVSMFIAEAKVTDEDIDLYYEQHGSEFMTEDQVKVEYLELNAAKIELDTKPDEVALQALYEEESARFTTEEERHARHILVLFNGADEEDIEEATIKADAIVKRLEAGETFDALAREMSEDPGSAPAGGDLGSFGRGIMVAEFEDAVFDMQVGERSEPVKSSYGLHIIELLDIKQETVTPFEDVRPLLVDLWLSGERSELFFERAEILTNLTFEYPDTLQEAASALGLEMQESDWMSKKAGTGIGATAEVIEAAFSEDVLLGGNNSSVVELGEDHIVVLRVSEHQKPVQKPLEDVKAVISASLQDEQARSLTEEKGEDLLASLQSGVALDAIAKELSLETGKTDLIGRNSGTPERGLVRKAFELNVPMDEQTVSGGFVMKNGNYAMVQLEETIEGQFDVLNKPSQMQVSKELGKLQGAANMAAVMSALNEKAVVYIPRYEN